MGDWDRGKYFFYIDCWWGELSLRDKLHRFFDLSEHKCLSVANMFSLGWGESGEAWKSRRRLFAWEDELVEECRILL